MIAGEHAQASGVQRQALVYAELGAEIGHMAFGDGRPQVGLKRGDGLPGTIAEETVLL